MSCAGGGGVRRKCPIVKESAVDVSLGLKEEECGGVVAVAVAGGGGGHGGDEKCEEENGVGKTVHFFGFKA